jgi:hypothetical protein
MRRSALHYFRVHHPGPVSWAMRGLVAGGALVRLVTGCWPIRRWRVTRVADPATERRIIRLALSGSPPEGRP